MITHHHNDASWPASEEVPPLNDALVTVCFIDESVEVGIQIFVISWEEHYGQSVASKPLLKAVDDDRCQMGCLGCGIVRGTNGIH
jgi:hypothetical protein